MGLGVVVAVAVSVGVGEGVWVDVRVGVRECVGLGVRVGVGVRVTVAVGVRVRVAVRVVVTVWVGVRVAVRVGVRVRVTVRVGVRVGVAATGRVGTATQSPASVHVKPLAQSVFDRHSLLANTRQVPNWLQRSPDVKKSPSSHAVPAGCGLCTQRSWPSLQLSAVHGSASAQLRAKWVQTKKMQSSVVQNRSSSQSPKVIHCAAARGGANAEIMTASAIAAPKNLNAETRRRSVSRRDPEKYLHCISGLALFCACALVHSPGHRVHAHTRVRLLTGKVTLTVVCAGLVVMLICACTTWRGPLVGTNTTSMGTVPVKSVARTFTV